MDTLPELQLVPCLCKRSATGFCTGLHRLTDQEWDKMLLDDAGYQSLPADADTTE